MNDIPNEKANLSVGGETLDLPVYKGSVGPEAIDITALYRQSGKFTYDPGFTSTASCESKITYIDGDQGVLLFRKGQFNVVGRSGRLWPVWPHHSPLR